MNCFARVKRTLRTGPYTTPELAEICHVSLRTMNARLQFYKYRGLVMHNGRVAPKQGGRGRRAKFWVLA